MMRKPILVGAGVAALVAAAAGGYWIGRTKIADTKSAAAGASSNGTALMAGDIDPKTGKRVLYWHDPMVPGQKFNRPGKSPFMDMELVPVYEEAGSGSGVSVSGDVRQSLGIRTAPVSQGSLAPEVHAVGTAVANERGEAVLQARTAGFVERLYVRITHDPVRRGQTVVTITAPEWAAVQEEYLALRRAPVPGAEGLIAAARQRMRLSGMSEDQIAAIERTGHTQLSLAVTAPASGVVTELGIREGMTVTPGQTLARIASLDPIWIDVQVAERESGLVRPGDRVEVEAAALPGQPLSGRVLALLPEVKAETRTRTVRVQVSNPRRLLVPGMTTSVTFTPSQATPALIVPSEALVRTGRRTILFVDRGGGRFAPVEVRIGREAGGQTEVLSGLQPDDRVVVSGQFLLDSEASLRGIDPQSAVAPPARKPPESAASSEGVPGIGVVEAVKPDSVTLSHRPMPELQWPAMTMTFGLRQPAPPSIKPGTRVRFAVVLDPEHGPVVTTIAPISGKPQP